MIFAQKIHVLFYFRVFILSLICKIHYEMGLLRFILAISVILAHSGSIFGFEILNSQAAVQSFYIISGFYMSLIIQEKYKFKRNSFKLFISNRFLRLFPVYWAILLLTILLSLGLFFNSHGANFGQMQPYLQNFQKMNFFSFSFLVFTNIFLFFQDIVMFLGLDTITGHLFFTSNYHNTYPALYTFLLVPQAWTISVEIMFYLIAPFLVKRDVKLILVLILISITLRMLIHSSGLYYDPWSYRFFPTECVFFLLGNISYRIYSKIKTLQINPLFSNLIFVCLILLTLFYSKLFTTNRLMCLYFTIFVIALPFIFNASKSWKKDRIIGELSYPMYISHILVLFLIQTFHFPILKNSLGLTLSILTVLFSVILNELISKKIEVLRQKRVTSSI